MRAVGWLVVLAALAGAAGQTTNASTGALPMLATPAPGVVASAGQATVVGWTGVALCGWCTWCQWCKK